jgi:hypothetical protein
LVQSKLKKIEGGDLIVFVSESENIDTNTNQILYKVERG